MKTKCKYVCIVMAVMLMTCCAAVSSSYQREPSKISPLPVESRSKLNYSSAKWVCGDWKDAANEKTLSAIRIRIDQLPLYPDAAGLKSVRKTISQAIDNFGKEKTIANVFALGYLVARYPNLHLLDRKLSQDLERCLYESSSPDSCEYSRMAFCYSIRLDVFTSKRHELVSRLADGELAQRLRKGSNGDIVLEKSLIRFYSSWKRASLLDFEWSLKTAQRQLDEHPNDRPNYVWNVLEGYLHIAYMRLDPDLVDKALEKLDQYQHKGYIAPEDKMHVEWCKEHWRIGRDTIIKIKASKSNANKL